MAFSPKDNSSNLTEYKIKQNRIKGIVEKNYLSNRYNLILTET